MPEIQFNWPFWGCFQAVKLQLFFHISKKSLVDKHILNNFGLSKFTYALYHSKGNGFKIRIRHKMLSNCRHLRQFLPDF